MKNVLSTVLVLIGLPMVLWAQDKKEVLFIGNSYTGSNNLPLMVYNVANSFGDTLIYDSRTPGGRRFLHHSSDPIVMSKINSRNWDYVVLQGQSQEVAFDSAFFYRDIAPHVKIICDSIRSNRACTQPLFYTTWGRQNGDPMNCPYLSWMCTYQGMDSALTANYTKLSKSNQAQMSPVGPVWNDIRSNYPNINLYSADGSHPSLAGSYAAACTFYTAIFKKDPRAINWNSNLSNAVADSIKMAVRRVLYDSLLKWNHSVNYPRGQFTFNNVSTRVSFRMDTTTQVDSVHWDFGDGNVSSLKHPTHNYQSVGHYRVQLTVFACGFQATHIDSVPMIISGIDAWDKKLNVMVYPNPIQDEFFIEAQFDASKSFNYWMLDAVGQLISRGNIENGTNSLHFNYPKGVYHLIIEGNGQRFHRKLIKSQ